jgi:hypothetical protein
MERSHTQAGADLTSCDLDETCAELDCDAVILEFGDALQGTPEGEAFLAHYCGLDFIGKKTASATGATGIMQCSPVSLSDLKEIG